MRKGLPYGNWAYLSNMEVSSVVEQMPAKGMVVSSSLTRSVKNKIIVQDKHYGLVLKTECPKKKYILPLNWYFGIIICWINKKLKVHFKKSLALILICHL